MSEHDNMVQALFDSMSADSVSTVKDSGAALGELVARLSPAKENAVSLYPFYSGAAPAQITTEQFSRAPEQKPDEERAEDTAAEETSTEVIPGDEETSTEVIPGDEQTAHEDAVADAVIADAVRAGMTKVNVSTHLNGFFTRAVREVLAADERLVDSRKYLAPARAALADEDAHAPPEGAVRALVAEQTVPGPGRHLANRGLGQVHVGGGDHHELTTPERPGQPQPSRRLVAASPRTFRIERDPRWDDGSPVTGAQRDLAEHCIRSWARQSGVPFLVERIDLSAP